MKRRSFLQSAVGAIGAAFGFGGTAIAAAHADDFTIALWINLEELQSGVWYHIGASYIRIDADH